MDDSVNQPAGETPAVLLAAGETPAVLLAAGETPASSSGPVVAAAAPAVTEPVRISCRQNLSEFVIVDAECSRYGDVVAAAQQGIIGVHFCVDGHSAVRLSRQFRADAWVVAADLPDMSGIDLIGLLSRHVQQADVDPLRSGSRISLGHLDRIRRPAIYLLGDTYRPEDEQRALVGGVSGYLVRPFNLDTLLNARFRRTH